MKFHTAQQKIEFGTVLPQNLTINENDSRIMICNQISANTITLKENSTLVVIAILTKGWEENQILTFNLEGENSHLTFLTIIIGKDKNTFKFSPVSHHLARNTESNFQVSCALFDNSSVECNGLLKIDKSAINSSAHLSHETLLLSENARVLTIPSLEIDTDEVKASHNASVVHPDEDQMFYLLSRGIGKSDTECILIKSFLNRNLNKLGNESVQKIISETIDEKL